LKVKSLLKKNYAEKETPENLDDAIDSGGLQMTPLCRQNSKRIIFVITAHGLGHAVRTVLVIQGLRKRCQRLEIVIATELDMKTITRFQGFADMSRFRRAIVS
jgi:hypothetical protein